MSVRSSRICMRTPTVKALLFSLPILAILWCVIRFESRNNFWGTVETPKAQCEAYDPERLHSLKTLSSEIYDQEKLLRLIREPQNTASNLVYVITGLAVVLASSRPMTTSLGLGCIFLGVGSGLYHASLLPEWRMVDILGVYIALLGMISIGLLAVFPKISVSRHNEFRLAYITWFIAFYAGIFRNDVKIAGFKIFDSTYIVVTAVAAGSFLALMAYKRTIDRRRYYRALCCFAISAPLAFAGGLGDRFGGFLADPNALIQGHSIWHSLGGIALLASYEIFASTGYDRSTFSTALKPANTGNSFEFRLT